MVPDKCLTIQVLDCKYFYSEILIFVKPWMADRGAIQGDHAPSNYRGSLIEPGFGGVRKP